LAFNFRKLGNADVRVFLQRLMERWKISLFWPP